MSTKLISSLCRGALLIVIGQITGCTSIGGTQGQAIDPIVPNKITISAKPLTLGQAGRVIAHEDGPFNFFPFTYCERNNPCPAQLSAMIDENKTRPLSQQIHFVKISIRTLKDGSWVVAHDQVQLILSSSSQAQKAARIAKGARVLDSPPPGKALFSFQQNGNVKYGIADSNSFKQLQRSGRVSIAPASSLPRDKKIVPIDLSTIDSSEFTQLQSLYGALLDVYRLKDFVTTDLAPNFAYMLYLKTDPNEQIIDDIDRLNINNRVVIESRSNDDAAWLHDHQGAKTGIFFTGRIDTSDDLDLLLSLGPQYGSKLWAIEVDYNNDTPALVKAVNMTKYISHVDSMSYDLLKEALATACEKPLVQLDSSTTMTSRPMDCLDKMQVIQNR